MYQIKILSIDGKILEKRHFMSRPSEFETQMFWVESLHRFGALIMLQSEKVRYIEISA